MAPARVLARGAGAGHQPVFSIGESRQRLGDRATIAVQDPVRLGSHSELQPDLALLRVRTDEYALRHPGPDDVLLLVEVADTTRRWDRERKMPLYAAAGVSEVWLLDVGAEELELFRRPQGGIYRDITLARPGDVVAPEAFPDVVLDVADPAGRRVRVGLPTKGCQGIPAT